MLADRAPIWKAQPNLTKLPQHFISFIHEHQSVLRFSKMIKYDYRTGEGTATPEQAKRIELYNYLASSSEKPRHCSVFEEVDSKINIFHKNYARIPVELSGVDKEQHEQWHRADLAKAVTAKEENSKKRMTRVGLPEGDLEYIYMEKSVYKGYVWFLLICSC